MFEKAKDCIIKVLELSEGDPSNYMTSLLDMVTASSCRLPKKLSLRCVLLYKTSSGTLSCSQGAWTSLDLRAPIIRSGYDMQDHECARVLARG